MKTMLSAELDTVLGRRPDLQVVTVADGAHDNWRYLDVLAPEATAVVDFYHAAEQLKSALDARYGENDARGRAQFHKLRHLLLDDPDGVEKVIRALDYQRKKFPRRTRIGEVLRYFRRNRPIACATPTPRPVIYPSAPASSRPPVKRWSRNGSSAPECDGAAPADRPS